MWALYLGKERQSGYRKMKKIKIASLLLLVSILFRALPALAQLNDAQWMLGPNTSNIDFRSAMPVNDSIANWMPTRFTNTAISNNAGEILYYTNGIYVAGKLGGGDTILNGGGLNPGAFTTQYANQGIPYPQASIFLPNPGDTQDRYYSLIHFSGDLNNGVAYTLFRSMIDKEANFGRGEVISKNDTFYQGITRTGGMAACKHANGRDWWVVLGSRGNNLYRKFLLTANGVKDTLLQNIGPNYQGPLDQSYSRFSLDGTKYVTGAFAGLITVMNFDRCTGEFSNPIGIVNGDGNFSSGVSSVEFSPNGRFVYAIDRTTVKQYDLTNPNIQDSIIIYRCGCPDGAQLNMFSLAYNGKIYGSTWAGGFPSLHVINSPNEKGLACDFVYEGQPAISINSMSVSNTANPRLGPLVGSGCDTLATDIRKETIEKKQQPRVQPNPAGKAFYIEMPAQGNYKFELLNEAGQTVAKRETRQVDIINVETLNNGIYFLNVYGKTKKLSTTKLIVQH